MASMCCAALGDADQAVELYDYVQRTGGDAKKPVEGRLNALLSVGAACVKKGAYDQAMSLYENALRDGLDDGKIYLQMGLCQMAEEDYEGAADSFDKGLGLLAAAYGTSRETAVLKAAIPAEDTWNLDALKELSYNRAVVLEYQQDYGKALSCFQEYVDVFGAEEDALHEIEFLKTR